jgi:hypothetical protein
MADVCLFKLMTPVTPLFSSLLVHLEVNIAGAIDVAGRSGLGYCQWQQVDRSIVLFGVAVVLVVGGKAQFGALQQSLSFLL